MTHVVEAQISGNQVDVKERFTMVQLIRRSNQIRIYPHRFADFGKVARKNPGTEVDARESSDEIHWKPETVKSVMSVTDNGRQTEAALLLGKFINTRPTLSVDHIGNELVSDEGGMKMVEGYRTGTCRGPLDIKPGPGVFLESQVLNTSLTLEILTEKMELGHSGK